MGEIAAVLGKAVRTRSATLLCAAWLGVLVGCAGSPPEPVDALSMGSARLGFPLESQMVETNGISLHVVMAGPAAGPPVLLLHGLPEFWWAWQNQIGPLVAAGFRVIVPDLRGFNASDKPNEVVDYRNSELFADAIGLIDALHYDKVSVAGHDSGAGIAWYLALVYPERIERLAVFGIAHPYAYRDLAAEGGMPLVTRAFYGGLAIVLKSGLAEPFFRAQRYAVLTKFLRWTSREGAFPESELELYRHAWHRGNAIRSVRYWYLADLEYAKPIDYPRGGRVELPVLISALGQDTTLPQAPVRDSVHYCADATLVEFEDATHWVLHERPEQTGALLANFFAGRPVRAPPDSGAN